MMSMRFIMAFAAGCILAVGYCPPASSNWSSTNITYRQAVTKLLKRGDITWGTKEDGYYNFSKVLVSRDGTKVLFTGACEYCSPAEVRPFLMDPDGTDIQDLSGMLPEDITNFWSAWRNMMINDDATKIFFRAVIEAGYYDDEQLFVYDINTSTLSLAVNQTFGTFGSAWHFRINEYGNTVYMDTYNDGWNETLQKSRKGLFYALTGATKTWYLDIDTLDCVSECGNLNLLGVLGVSPRNDVTFFQWNTDYWKNDEQDHVGLWYTGLGGSAALLSDEHYWIDDGDQRGISNADGTQMIYSYRHSYGDPMKLAVVSVPSGTEQIVGWTSGLNGFDAHMTRSGEYILTRGEYGDHGTYYQTLIDLQAGTSRDTWSYYLPSMWGSTSNITGDDRYYYYSIDGWPNSGEDVAGLYRIDMKTTGDSSAPYVQQIEFSAPALIDDEGKTIQVRARITDPQGLRTIDWVRLVPQVEGQEEPAWSMGREPLAFPSGDLGSTLLYDDGTHGDATTGDGVYTFDSIATRKGDYEGFNTWYQHYALPATVGIRILVKDTDNNYGIADTQLLIQKPESALPFLYLLLLD